MRINIGNICYYFYFYNTSSKKTIKGIVFFDDVFRIDDVLLCIITMKVGGVIF